MEGKEKQVYCGDHHITSLVSGKQAINNDDDNTDDNDVENVIYIHLYMWCTITYIQGIFFTGTPLKSMENLG